MTISSEPLLTFEPHNFTCITADRKGKRIISGNKWCHKLVYQYAKTGSTYKHGITHTKKLRVPIALIGLTSWLMHSQTDHASQ